MSALYFTLAVVTVAFNVFSGTASMLRLAIIYPLLDGANVPRSWLVFPIGVLKTAGGLGVLAGLLFAPWIGTVAAAGLVMFWVCALYTHVLANFWPRETILALVFLALAAGTLATDLLRA
ncbi:DoxX family protein [Glycomyces xiaoerkulensis]|uniref:DoxX family protein n=1 Tax=Glycomyces xiaoerkulensis TaxID=2038139 RepID=UPI000C265F31|nr:DoxX family protein [Glycomyces xiaoerkulensis]